MADTEKVSLGKFAHSFVELLPWVKTIRYCVGAALILGVALFIYLKFKPQTQNTTFSGSVGKVNIIQSNKRFFIPFVEGGVEKNTNSNRDFDTYLRAGLRFEF